MPTRLLDKVKSSLQQVQGVDVGASIFSEDETEGAFYVNGTQIGHFIDANSIELRLTRNAIRENRAMLKADPRVVLRRNTSDWLTVSFATTNDVPFLLQLAELAAAAHRPRNGVASKPPPFGAELARRRRFH